MAGPRLPGFTTPLNTSFVLEGPECSQSVCAWCVRDHQMPGARSLRGFAVCLVSQVSIQLSSCMGPTPQSCHPG